MTTASNVLPAPGPVPDPPLSRLSPLILLGIYLVVPAIVLFVLLDAIATGLDFSRRISFDTQLLMMVSLLLQTPHAMASLFTFADREYITNYKATLIKCGFVGLGTLALIILVGDMLFMLCLLIYNSYHQCSQQAGISAMVARNKSRLHETWRWMSIVIHLIGFLAILGRNEPGLYVAPGLTLALGVTSVLFLAAFGLVSLQLARQSKTQMGVLLIGAQAAMLYVYAIMYVLNLPLLMILAPVVVHDLTAFAFYINHNANRNRETRHNFFSKLRNIVPVPELILTPMVAMGLGLCMVTTGINTTTFAIWAILWNVMHIYVEGVIWKAGSPHRQHTLV